MPQIHYVEGDATDPIEVGDGPRIIAHVCNDVGGWGAGFVLALSNRDSRPEWAYRALFAGDVSDPELGDTFLVSFDPAGENSGLSGVYVANMIAQRGFRTVLHKVPLDYAALAKCLDKVGKEAADTGATVHMPRIGCGLAGGEWERVEAIVFDTLCTDHGIEVYVYDLPQAGA